MQLWRQVADTLDINNSVNFLKGTQATETKIICVSEQRFWIKSMIFVGINGCS